jgi:hypothetical protein
MFKKYRSVDIKIFKPLHSYSQHYDIFFFGIKTEFNNPKKFKMVLQKFLYEKSFYCLDENFDFQKH